jgi:L-lactate dehydrogenase complex protein LldF
LKTQTHSAAAKNFTNDFDRTSWHDETLWFVRKKRDKAVYATPEFQALRNQASTIKDLTLSNLDRYLEQFEKNATANGVTIHWAETANDHNRIILDIIQSARLTKVVKSKSMLTEECHLNPFLQGHGIEVVDTDLGERIIQLRHEAPSHIVLPAVHLKKEDVAATFHEYLGTPECETDPQALTAAARTHLRKKFLESEVAITGVNFAVAETGSIVVCTNEGNADLGVNLAKIHIACMGIEKIIPCKEDLGVFIRLLGRSATGQLITTYTSHFTKPEAGKQMHIVIVDNGRTQQLRREDFRSSLKCIRCGACMNTCPVYRRSGGHSYHATVPGPIGSILSPNLDLKKYSDLPFASTLCGSCTDVCPVKIDIHTQLFKWRQVIREHNELPFSKKLGMIIMARVLARPWLYAFSGRVVRWLMRNLPQKLTHLPGLNPWAKSRDMPSAPKTDFRTWYKINRSTDERTR